MWPFNVTHTWLITRRNPDMSQISGIAWRWVLGTRLICRLIVVNTWPNVATICPWLAAMRPFNATDTWLITRKNPEMSQASGIAWWWVLGTRLIYGLIVVNTWPNVATICPWLAAIWPYNATDTWLITRKNPEMSQASGIAWWWVLGTRLIYGLIVVNTWPNVATICPWLAAIWPYNATDTWLITRKNPEMSQASGIAWWWVLGTRLICGLILVNTWPNVATICTWLAAMWPHNATDTWLITRKNPEMSQASGIAWWWVLGTRLIYGLIVVNTWPNVATICHWLAAMWPYNATDTWLLTRKSPDMSQISGVAWRWVLDTQLTLYVGLLWWIFGLM